MMEMADREPNSDLRHAEPSEWHRNRMARQKKLHREILKPALISPSDPNAGDVGWYCLNVLTGREFAVEAWLRDNGVEAFVPRETVVKLVKGVRREHDRACFAGYVFVRISPSPLAFERLGKVRSVLGFLRTGERYHSVSDRTFGTGRGKLNADRMKHDKSIGDGCRVVVIYGPFAGLKCVVVQVTNPKARSPSAKVWSTLYGKEISNVPLAFMERI